jgi:hypothetical protein
MASEEDPQTRKALIDKTSQNNAIVSDEDKRANSNDTKNLSKVSQK